MVSRNCTEDGWSEPFPHYFDACGFDEYESETGDQVSVCFSPGGGGMRLRRWVEGCVYQRPGLLMGVRKLRSPGSVMSTCCVACGVRGRDFHSLTLG